MGTWHAQNPVPRAIKKFLSFRGWLHKNVPLERGERNLALINIERIANALKMTLSQLMKGL